MVIRRCPPGRCRDIISDRLDGASRGQGVNMAIGDWRREREMRSDAGVVRPLQLFPAPLPGVRALLLEGPDQRRRAPR